MADNFQGLGITFYECEGCTVKSSEKFDIIHKNPIPKLNYLINLL